MARKNGKFYDKDVNGSKMTVWLEDDIKEIKKNISDFKEAKEKWELRVAEINKLLSKSTGQSDIKKLNDELSSIVRNIAKNDENIKEQIEKLSEIESQVSSSQVKTQGRSKSKINKVSTSNKNQSVNKTVKNNTETEYVDRLLILVEKKIAEIKSDISSYSNRNVGGKRNTVVDKLNKNLKILENERAKWYKTRLDSVEVSKNIINYMKSTSKMSNVRNKESEISNYITDITNQITILEDSKPWQNEQKKIDTAKSRLNEIKKRYDQYFVSDYNSISDLEDALNGILESNIVNKINNGISSVSSSINDRKLKNAAKAQKREEKKNQKEIIATTAKYKIMFENMEKSKTKKLEQVKEERKILDEVAKKLKNSYERSQKLETETRKYQERQRQIEEALRNSVTSKTSRRGRGTTISGTKKVDGELEFFKQKSPSERWTSFEEDSYQGNKYLRINLKNGQSYSFNKLSDKYAKGSSKYRETLKKNFKSVMMDATPQERRLMGVKVLRDYAKENSSDLSKWIVGLDEFLPVIEDLIHNSTGVNPFTLKNGDKVHAAQYAGLYAKDIINLFNKDPELAKNLIGTLGTVGDTHSGLAIRNFKMPQEVFAQLQKEIVNHKDFDEDTKQRVYYSLFGNMSEFNSDQQDFLKGQYNSLKDKNFSLNVTSSRINPSLGFNKFKIGDEYLKKGTAIPVKVSLNQDDHTYHYDGNNASGYKDNIGEDGFITSSKAGGSLVPEIVLTDSVKNAATTGTNYHLLSEYIRDGKIRARDFKFTNEYNKMMEKMMKVNPELDSVISGFFGEDDTPYAVRTISDKNGLVETTHFKELPLKILETIEDYNSNHKVAVDKKGKKMLERELGAVIKIGNGYEKLAGTLDSMSVDENGYLLEDLKFRTAPHIFEEMMQLNHNAFLANVNAGELGLDMSNGFISRGRIIQVNPYSGKTSFRDYKLLSPEEYLNVRENLKAYEQERELYGNNLANAKSDEEKAQANRSLIESKQKLLKNLPPELQKAWHQQYDPISQVNSQIDGKNISYWRLRGRNPKSENMMSSTLGFDANYKANSGNELYKFWEEDKEKGTNHAETFLKNIFGDEFTSKDKKSMLIGMLSSKSKQFYNGEGSKENFDNMISFYSDLFRWVSNNYDYDNQKNEYRDNRSLKIAERYLHTLSDEELDSVAKSYQSNDEVEEITKNYLKRFAVENSVYEQEEIEDNYLKRLVEQHIKDNKKKSKMFQNQDEAIEELYKIDSIQRTANNRDNKIEYLSKIAEVQKIAEQINDYHDQTDSYYEDQNNMPWYDLDNSSNEHEGNQSSVNKFFRERTINRYGFQVPSDLGEKFVDLYNKSKAINPQNEDEFKQYNKDLNEILFGDEYGVGYHAKDLRAVNTVDSVLDKISWLNDKIDSIKIKYSDNELKNSKLNEHYKAGKISVKDFESDKSIESLIKKYPELKSAVLEASANHQNLNNDVKNFIKNVYKRRILGAGSTANGQDLGFTIGRGLMRSFYTPDILPKDGELSEEQSKERDFGQLVRDLGDEVVREFKTENGSSSARMDREDWAEGILKKIVKMYSEDGEGFINDYGKYAESLARRYMVAKKEFPSSLGRFIANAVNVASSDFRNAKKNPIPEASAIYYWNNQDEMGNTGRSLMSQYGWAPSHMRYEHSEDNDVPGKWYYDGQVIESEEDIAKIEQSRKSVVPNEKSEENNVVKEIGQKLINALQNVQRQKEGISPVVPEDQTPKNADQQETGKTSGGRRGRKVRVGEKVNHIEGKIASNKLPNIGSSTKVEVLVETWNSNIKDPSILVEKMDAIIEDANINNYRGKFTKSGGSSGDGGDGGSNKNDKEAAKLARLEARENEKEFKSIMGQFTALSKEKMRLSREIDLTPDWDSTKKNALTGNYIEVDAELSSVMSDLERYKNIVSSDTFQRGMDDYTKKIEAFKRSMNLQKGGAQNIWQTLGNSFKNMIYQFTQMGAAYAIIGKVRQAIQRIITDSQNLDKALTNIRIVTGKTSEETQQLMISYSKLGHELSATTTEVATSANEWLRQGYEVAEVNDLITASLHLSKLGMIESSQATEYLTSTLKGFKIQASDVMDIVDKLTAIDMSAAVSAGGIAQALQNFANVASMSGLDIDQSAAMASTIIDVSQKDPSSVGNAIKTMLSRYGNVKAGVYAGMDLDDGSIDESINDIEKVLSKLGISIRKSRLEMRDFDDVLSDIAEKWNTLDSVSQNAVATAMAGVRQRESFVTLMNNMDKYEKLLETSRNSEGTAEEKYLSYAEQLEASQKRLAAEWEELAQSAEINEFLIKITDVATFMVDKLPIILKYLTRIITLTQGYKIPSLLPVASQFLGIGKIDKNKFSLKSYYGKNFDEKVSKYYDNADNKRGGLFGGVTQQLRQFSQSLINAVKSVENFSQTNNIAAHKTQTEINHVIDDYSDVSSSWVQSIDSSTEANINAALSEKTEAQANYTSAASEELESKANINSAQSENMDSSSSLLGFGLGGKSKGSGKAAGKIGGKAAGKALGAAAGGVMGFMTAETTKLNWVTGEEEEMSDTAGIVSKINTGLATAIGSIWGPLIGMAAGMVADILNKYLIGPLIDRDNDLLKQSVKQAEENLAVIGSIESSVKNIEKFSTSDISYESYKEIVSAVNELKSTIMSDGQVSQDILNSLYGQIVAGVAIMSALDIESLLDKYVSDPDSRDEIELVISKAVGESRYKNLITSEILDLEESFKNIKEYMPTFTTTTTNIWSSGNKTSSATPGFLELKDMGINFSLEDEENEILTQAVYTSVPDANGGTKTQVDYVPYGNMAIKEYTYDMNNIENIIKYQEQYIEVLKKLNQDTEEAEKDLRNLRVEVGKFSEMLEERNTLIAQNALYSAEINGQDILSMTSAQLKELVSEDESIIYNAVKQAVVDNYGGFEFYNIFSEKAFNLIEQAIKSNEKLYNAYIGADVSLSEALKNPENNKTIDNFANAFGVSTDQLKSLENIFGDITLSEVLSNLSETKNSLSEVENLFLSMSEYSGITSDNVELILEKFPELLPYLSDATALAGKLLDKQTAYSQLYTKKLLGNQVESSEYLDIYKSYLSKDVIESLNQSEFADVTNIKSLFQLFSMSDDQLTQQGFSIEQIEEMKNVYNDLFTYEIEDVYSKEQYNKYIDYLTKINELQIENLENQKSAMENITRQREYENKLIEAKLKLEDAQKEKKRVWREGVGWTYEADQTKIEEAQVAIKELENQKTIDELNLEVNELKAQNDELSKIKEQEELDNLQHIFDAFVSDLSDSLGSDATYGAIVNAIKDGVSATVTVSSDSAYDEWLSGKSGLKESIENSYNDLFGSNGLKSQILEAAEQGDYETAGRLMDEYNVGYNDYINKMDQYNNTYDLTGEELKTWDQDMVDKYKSDYSPTGDSELSEIADTIDKRNKSIIIDGTPYLIDSKELTWNSDRDHYKWLKGDIFDGNGKIMQGVEQGEEVSSGNLQEFDTDLKKSKTSMAELIADQGWKNVLLVGDYGDDEWGYVDGRGVLHKLTKYSSGILQTSNIQDAIINEKGTEAIVTPHGTITSLPAHTGIVPADITSNLWQLGELAPSILRSLGGPSNLLSGSVNNHSAMTDESFNVNTINMTVEADSSFDPQAFVNAIKTRISLTKNNKKY